MSHESRSRMLFHVGLPSFQPYRHMQWWCLFKEQVSMEGGMVLRSVYFGNFELFPGQTAGLMSWLLPSAPSRFACALSSLLVSGHLQSQTTQLREPFTWRFL